MSHRHTARDAIFACRNVGYLTKLLLWSGCMSRVTARDNQSLRIMQIVTVVWLLFLLMIVH